MNWIEIINTYYKLGLYTEDQVKVFVIKGKISETDFQNITGQVYTV